MELSATLMQEKGKNTVNFFGVKAPLNDSGEDEKLTTDFMIELTSLSASVFYFVLSLGVTTPLITPIMSID